MRAVANEQFDKISGLLQGDTSEQVIEGIQAVGQRAAAAARAHHIISAQNHRVKNNAAYRENPDFILGFIDGLIGKEPIPSPGSPADKNYARDLNAALLRAIESTVRGFPLSSDLDGANWDEIKRIKSEASQKITHMEDSVGVFKWNS